jgi:hypothetical protein
VCLGVFGRRAQVLVQAEILTDELDLDYHENKGQRVIENKLTASNDMLMISMIADINGQRES